MRVLETLGWAETSSVFVIMHAPVPPREDDFDALMEAAAASKAPRYLIFAEVPLSAGQRARVAKIVNEQQAYSAVLLESPMTRGVTTALGWLTGGRYRAFSPTAIDEALAYLGVEPTENPSVHDTVKQLGRELRKKRAGAA